MMKDTSGFYKEENGEWLFAPNFIYAKNYTLERNGNRESVDGWHWHDKAPHEYIEWLEKQNENEEF